MKWCRTIAVFTMAVMPMTAANAASTDSMIEGAKLCTRHLPRYERERAIPTHLLSAIATTESGRYHDGLKMKLPWPWAINAAGKGYYLDSKDEAIAMVKKLRARGIRSIDVGCMQVNLQQHPDAFASLDRAFDPQTNVAYAATFLHSLYEETGSWKKAAGYYHSRTPVRGQSYVGNVYSSWYTIIDKLRAARLQVPESSVVAMNELKNGSAQQARPVKQVTTRVNPHVIHLAAAQPVAKLKPAAGSQKAIAQKSNGLPEQAGRKVAAHEAPRMNSIKVTTAPVEDAAPERTRSIIVVRQDTAPQDALPPEIKMAANSLPQTPIPTGAVSTPAVMSDASPQISFANERRPVMATVGRKAGPSFIFND